MRGRILLQRRGTLALTGQKSSMRILTCAIVLLVAVAACVETPTPPPGALNVPSGESNGPPRASTPIDIEGEMVQLRAALMREVPGAKATGSLAVTKTEKVGVPFADAL